MKHQKITRELARVNKNLSIKFHVPLANGKDNPPIVSEYTMGKHSGVTLNMNCYISMDYKSDIAQWSKDMNVLISLNSISRVTREFNKMQKYLYEKPLYAITSSGEHKLYADVAKECTIVINVNSSHKILLKPTVIYDNNGTTYEGVLLYINKTDYAVELPLDNFETICYILNRTDFIQTSQQMLTFYYQHIQINNTTKVNGNPQVEYVKPRNIFEKSQSHSETKPTVDGNIRDDSSEKNKELFGGLDSAKA